LGCARRLPLFSGRVSHDRARPGEQRSGPGWIKSPKPRPGSTCRDYLSSIAVLCPFFSCWGEDEQQQKEQQQGAWAEEQQQGAEEQQQGAKEPGGTGAYGARVRARYRGPRVLGTEPIAAPARCRAPRGTLQIFRSRPPPQRGAGGENQNLQVMALARTLPGPEVTEERGDRRDG
jgi:hypothetical protein